MDLYEAATVLGDRKVYVRHHFTVIETKSVGGSRCKECKKPIVDFPVHWAADTPTDTFGVTLRFCSTTCIDTWEDDWLQRRAGGDRSVFCGP